MTDAELMTRAMERLEAVTTKPARDLKVGDVVVGMGRRGWNERSVITSVVVTKRGLIRTTDAQWGERVRAPYEQVTVYTF